MGRYVLGDSPSNIGLLSLMRKAPSEFRLERMDGISVCNLFLSFQLISNDVDF